MPHCKRAKSRFIIEVYNKSDLLRGWSFSVGKNRPHDLIYYKGGFIMVFIIRPSLYGICYRLSLRPSFVSIRGTAINCEYENLIGTFSSETFHWLWKSGKKIRFGSRSGPGQILHVSFFPFFLVFVYNGGSIVINWPSL